METLGRTPRVFSQLDDFSIYLTHLANSYVAQGNQQIWLVLMAAVSALALWRGGEPERVAAVGVLVAWFLTPLAQVPIDLYDPQWGMLAVDTAFLGLLLTLALRSNRIWLLFAAAFQLLGVVIHMAIVVDPSLRSLVYMRGLVIWSYLVLASLAVGAATTARRRTRTA